MAWARLDDKRALHRKFRRKGFAVRGLDEAAITYSAHEETDGFISDDALEDIAHHHGVSIKATVAYANTLVEMNRWDRHDDLGKWEVLGYLDFNPSHADLEAGRKRDRERKRSKPDSTGNPDGTDTESAGNP
jgi:hypothetical protein